MSRCPKASRAGRFCKRRRGHKGPHDSGMERWPDWKPRPPRAAKPAEIVPTDLELAAGAGDPVALAAAGGGAVIIDEASDLTPEQLDALHQRIVAVSRRGGP